MAFMSPPVDMTLQGFALSFFPGTLIPRVFASQAVTTGGDNPGEPALVVAFEFPQQSAASVDKPAQETQDVDAFLRDTLPPERITSACIVNPNDPPDVLAYVDGTEVGIEATQFIPPEPELDKANWIVGRWKSFGQFRSKVLEQEPAQPGAAPGAAYRDALRGPRP